ncbi:hypothetical protein LOZ36_006792 [Ophidiomyces ophidiicola]|nr:hypothetical protein LOZ36_006792 [Ophidiomyces ophidiicola]
MSGRQPCLVAAEGHAGVDKPYHSHQQQEIEWSQNENRVRSEGKKSGHTRDTLENSHERSPGACDEQYGCMRHDPKLIGRWPQRWEKEEDDILVNGRRANKGWNEISKLLPKRSAKGCKNRYRYLQRNPGPTHYKRSWTEKEDNTLLNGRKMNKSWNEISKLLPKRSAKGCKHRYSYLQCNPGPTHYKRSWTEKEDNTLLNGRKMNED